MRSIVPGVDVLLVSPDPASREQMALSVRSIERALRTELRFRAAANGELGIRAALRDRPDIVVADEIASRAGAFALAKALRDDSVPFTGVIVILLERKHDAWLARWSGADAWYVKPVDPFELGGSAARTGQREGERVKIKGTDKRTQREFLVEQVIENGGASPWDGQPFSPDYAVTLGERAPRRRGGRVQAGGSARGHRRSASRTSRLHEASIVAPLEASPRPPQPQPGAAGLGGRR